MEPKEYLESVRGKYPPNNEKAKREAELKLKGSAKVQKSLKRKFFDAMIGSDINDVGSFLIWDCLVPSLKYALIDSILMIFGEGPAARRPRGGTSIYNNGTSTINYSGYSSLNNRNRQMDQNQPPRRVSTKYAVDEIMFDYREDAESILDLMIDRIIEFGQVSVADAFDYAGVSVDDFTMHDWGWKDLSQAKVRKIRGYWILDMPRAISLK